MRDKESLHKITLEIQKGMQLVKCRKCGCMSEMLENFLASLPLAAIEGSSGLVQNVRTWLEEMEPVEYTCLGCEHCFPAVVANILTANFPSMIQAVSWCCDFEVKEQVWPPVAGEYFAFCEGSTCSVAVSTLASVELAETLANIRPRGLCIVGKTETENIGIDKIIKNTITNPAIHSLIVAGRDPQGHYSGKTILALSEEGVDTDMKVINAPGRRPVLKNVSVSEVGIFRRQVQVINMIGCEDTRTITDKISELSKGAASSCVCKECSEPMSPIQISTTPKILAGGPKKLKMDKAGYFVVIPSLEKNIIAVEHYRYDNKLLHIIEGKNASSIYTTIIEKKWVTELSHAAYLGGELTKAAYSLTHGFRYIQDKAPGTVEDDAE